MWLQTICGIIACEALVQLWFHAAPLQGIRFWLVKLTPFLYSECQQTHLLNCKYCCSVWAAVLLVILFYVSPEVFLFIVLILTFHRISNFLHLAFSLLRDKQIDLRINRGK